MFSELTTPERQRVAQAYMPQMGGRSPADIGTMVQQLLTNNDLAARAMDHYNSLSGGNANDAGMRSQGGLESLMSSMMAQDGTPEVTTAPIPPKRTANVPRQVDNASIPPTKPTEFSGDDRVAKAGGPGSTGGTSASTANPTAVAENSSDSSMSSIILSALAALGIGGGAAALMRNRNGKTLPPEVNAPTDIVPTGPAKVLPPEAGGLPVPAQDRFAQAFGDDITDAEYREVAPKQIDTQKKLAGPKETDDRDNVKKADGKPIAAEDATDEAGVNRTLNKGKATTAKEKLKLKVRVR